MYCLIIWILYCIFCYIRYHTWYNELCSKKRICFSIFFLFANFRVCFNTKLHKNIPNVYFMVILFKLATCHVRNTFERPLRPNAQTARVLTCVIEGNWIGFQKIIPYKNPRHGAPGSIGSSTAISLHILAFGLWSPFR